MVNLIARMRATFFPVESYYIDSLPADKLVPDYIYCGGLCADPLPPLRHLNQQHKCAVCGSGNYARLSSLQTVREEKVLQHRVAELEKTILSLTQQLIEKDKSTHNLEEELRRIRGRRKTTATKIKGRVLQLRAEIARLRTDLSTPKMKRRVK